MVDARYDPRALADGRNRGDLEDHFRNLQQFRRQYVKPVSELKEKFDKVEEMVRGLAKQYERPGTLVELSVDAALSLVSQIVGPVEDHPFIKFHKLHFEALITLARASTAASRMQQSLQKAYEISSGILNDGNKSLEPYRRNGKHFRHFRETINPVLVGAWLLRGMVTKDIQELSRLRPGTIKGNFDLANSAHRVHMKARARANEIFEVYVALHQSLWAVISLRSDAERDLKNMSSETGTFRGMAKSMGQIAQSASDFGMLLNSDNKNVADEPGHTITSENLADPIEAAIDDATSVIKMWIDADQKFIDDLYGQDVFAAMRH